MEQENNTYSAETQPEKPNQIRLYDCVFCKRGFTNAQALGGHMNIHRKDKAKPKPKPKPKHKPYQYPSSTFPRILTADYQAYVPPPNPILQTVSYDYCFFPVWRDEDDHLEDRIHRNLSLTTGRDKDEEVDLELRLGRLL